MTWSEREAERLQREVDLARISGQRRPRNRSGRTIDALIQDYRQHRSFQKLAEASRRSYSANLSIIARKWGPQLVDDFTKPVIAQWYETNYVARGKTQALSLNRTLSILFGHAELIGWRPAGSNPAKGIKAEVPAPRARVANWTEVDALVAAAEDLGRHAMALAILIGVYQGQRQTDIREALRGQFRQVQLIDPETGKPATYLAWSLRRSKRQTEGAMAIHPDLEPRLRRCLMANTQHADGPLLIDEATGKPYSVWLFRDRFDEIRARAERDQPSVATLTFRDLRRTFGHFARSGGASRDDTGDVLGNSSAADPRLGETYMAPQFWTATRAVLAIRRPSKEKGKKA
ncbi:hypothetical protein JMM59_14565 [Rhodovulum sulfidophilum]|uniref:hypothetical protein n=1 Tax=Rhodovulum sulfidophilum TaxID=35806 RepID=UPI001923CFD3|nr:hypothetical protein [Rhodovulum sulfidophilum]MBL3566212.1 hypothetical protein [Rhodovulum sulfidophilum]